MKTKKSLLTLVLLFVGWVQLQAVPFDQKKLIGKWEYSAPTAPPNYTTGQLNFIQAGDKIKGELIIEGQKVDFQEITFKDDEVTAVIFLESTPITTKFKLVNQALEGKAETPDGPVAIKAVRK
jgi:hypothetical protein